MWSWLARKRRKSGATVQRKVLRTRARGTLIMAARGCDVPLPGKLALAAALVLANGGVTPAEALTSQTAEVTWSARAASQSEASSAQQALLLTLHNTGRLPLRRVRVSKGEFPGDTMRRSGAWVGNVSGAADALLCDLNPKICSRSKRNANSRERRSDTTHIAGYRISGSTRWRASAGSTLIIPDVKIVQVFRQENGKRFRTNTNALVTAAQVSRVPACLDTASKFCVTDYSIASQDRTTAQNQLRSVMKVLPSFSKDAKDAYALVPYLTVRLSLSEAMSPSYSRMPRAKRHSFNDPGYKRLLSGIGNNIQGRFAADYKSLPEEEPKFDRQRDVFEQFFNVARHGMPKPHENARPITIVIVDHKPNIAHCDFEAARIEMLPEPGTFESATVSGPTSDTAGANGSDCEIQESPWLREFHGTHILGLAAAKRNRRGGAGLLSHYENVTFKVIPIDIDRLRGDENYVSELSVSLREAIFNYGATIINLSWAYTPVDGGGQRDEIRDLIDQTSNFVAWFAAAGNEGTNANDGVCNTRPACFSHPNVAGIVAVERTEDGSGFRLLGDGTETNIGWEAFDLAAPGRNIWSTVGQHEMAAASGTSQSTIIATSAAALVMSKETLTPRAAIQRLIYTSRLVPSLKHGVNGGIVDVAAALKFRRDQLWLDDGCAYLGQAKKLSFDNGSDLLAGDFVIDSENPVNFESLGSVHFNLDEVRRLYYDEETDSYIAFYIKSNSEILRRVNGDFGTRRDKRILRFQIEDSRGEDCEAPQRRINIPLDRVRDFIRRTRP